MIKKALIIIFIFLGFFCFAKSPNISEAINDKIYNAIIENRLNDLQILLHETKNINEPTTLGKSIFDAVFVFDNCEAAEILFQNKIDVYKKNNNGMCIYDQIMKKGNSRLKYLLNLYYK